MKQTRKRISLILAICMLMTMLPVTAYAVGEEGSEEIPDVNVSSEDELIAALESTTSSAIKATGDIELKKEVIMGMNHTLVIPDGKTLTITGKGVIEVNGNTFSINGGGTVVIEKDWYDGIGGLINYDMSSTLELENVTINLNNTGTDRGGLGYMNITVGDGAIINMNSETAQNQIYIVLDRTLRIDNGGQVYINKFTDYGIINQGTIHINGGKLYIGKGSSSKEGIGNGSGYNKGIENESYYNEEEEKVFGALFEFSSGSLDAAKGGGIYFAEGSSVKGMENKLNDRGKVLSTDQEVEVKSRYESTPEDNLTNGFYVWDEEMFVKKGINIIVQPNDNITVTEGSIKESLEVEVISTGEVKYQWYGYHVYGEGEGDFREISIKNATSSKINMPTDLKAGTYSFRCDIDLKEIDEEIDEDESNKYVTVIVTVNPRGGGNNNDDDGNDDNGGSNGGSKDKDASAPAVPRVPTVPAETAKKPIEQVLNDVGTHWALKSIQFIYDRGIMKGTSAEQFSPEAQMNRGMLITALGRLAGINVLDFTSGSFNDVDMSSYYGPYAEWSLISNITRGTGNNNFSPDNPVTREELAVILVNFAKAMGYELASGEGAQSFEDDSSISSWAKEAVQIMRNSNIIQGDPNNNFNPKTPATRAEIARVLQGFIDYMGL